MKTKPWLASASTLLFIAFSIIVQAQNVGIGTTSPGTKLDVNGAITMREGSATVSGTGVTIPDGYSQVKLTGTPTGTFTITAPTAPVNAGQRLVIYNQTTGGYAGTFLGRSIDNGTAVEFIFTNSTWVATSVAAVAAGTYIQNQTGTAQSGAGFNTAGSGTIGGTLSVSGVSTLAALTQTGTTNINTSGTAVTTIGSNSGGKVNLNTGSAIAVNTASPSASAVLDLSGNTNKGMVMPMLTTTQRNAITAPALGLMIYNTDNNCLEVNATSGSANWLSSCPCKAGPSSPGAVTGTLTGLCSGNSYTYAVPTVNSAQYYVWTITNGTIVSGQGTNSVTVTFSSSSGTLTVAAGNSCGISTPTAASLSFATVGSAGTVASASGYTIFNYNASGVVFTLPAVTNATSYTWSLSSTATASITAQSSNSCTVTFAGTLGTPTTITVNCTANGCSNSVAATGLSVQYGGKATYSGTGAAQSWGGSTYGVTSANVQLWGAGGGTASGGLYNCSSGGSGGYVTGTLAVTAGSAYSIVVGIGGTTTATTVYGGGGSGGYSGYSGGGGGRSAIINASSVEVATAGGGGGSGYAYGASYGGAGGSTTSTGNGGTGGGVTAALSGSNGGTRGCYSGSYCGTNGSTGTGGNGNNTNYYGGGGGGGYLGGGGGAGDYGGGGGGGSSYSGGLTSPTSTAGTTNTGAQTLPGYTSGDYVSGVGTGGANANNTGSYSGGNGYVVIKY